ncbi:hypothetical protein GE21DRAFT_1268200 [Neurospora crassa]|nr:hypothetical protein GE21DRAFT_1268200 [Neurospora crassa]
MCPTSDTKVMIKFARERDEGFYHLESTELQSFTNVREAHVVCLDGLEYLNGAEETGLPCSMEKVSLVDEQTGKMETSF